MRVKPPYKKQIQIKYVRQTPGVCIKQQISYRRVGIQDQEGGRSKIEGSGTKLSCMYIVVLSRGTS